MTIVRLVGFTGEIPRTIPRMLPEMASQNAFNTRLEKGDLRPFREPRNEFSAEDLPVSAPSTIYRFLDEWLYWDSLVKAAPGPVAEDRLYYTGDGTPKMYTGGTAYEMAVPGPTAALTLALGGSGAGDVTTRLYVYTNVSEFGEESKPSPISDPIDWQPGNDVTLSGFSTAMGDRTATLQRIYRSQTSASGDTTLYFIAERAADTADYVDTIEPDQFGEPLPSQDWDEPPDDLSGLIALPNGMMAAFVGKSLYFSEPYQPHAWPQKYILTTDYAQVALGAYGSTLVVMTTGNPYIAQGTAPENMAMEKLELNLPCVAAGAVVDLGYAVAYPSRDGLVSVSASGAQVISSTLFTKEDWNTLVPEELVAAQYDGRYVASYHYTDDDDVEQEGTLIFDLSGGNPYLLRSSDVGLSFFFDVTTSQLFFLADGIIWEFDAVGKPNKTLSWKSKEFVLPTPTNLGAILIETDAMSDAERAAIQAEYDALLAENEALFAEDSIFGEINGASFNEYAINGDILNQLPDVDDALLSVQVYADKVLVATVTKYNRMARLPGGFLARVWEVVVTSNIPVVQITLANTGTELRQAP